MLTNAFNVHPCIEECQNKHRLSISLSWIKYKICCLLPEKFVYMTDEENCEGMTLSTRSFEYSIGLFHK